MIIDPVKEIERSFRRSDDYFNLHDEELKLDGKADGPMVTCRKLLAMLGVLQEPMHFNSWFTLRATLYGISMLFYMLSSIVKLTTDFQNIGSSSYALIILAVGSALNVRYVMYHTRVDELKHLIESFEVLYKVESAQKWKKEKLDRSKIIADKITLYYFISFVLLIIIKVIIDVIGNWNDTKLKLSFDLWTPFENYYAAQLFQWFYLSASISSLTLAYNLLMSFSFQISVYINMLCEELKGLGKHFGKPTSNNAIKNCIKLHTEIIRLVKLENRVIGPGLFTEYFMISVMTCIALFIGQTGPPRDKVIGYLCFIVFCAMSAMLCWCGSLIEEKSEMITISAYSSGWEEASPKERKLLLILMCAAKKPLSLRVTPGIHIGLKQYSSFLQKTYSYLTGLRALEGNS